MSRAQQDHPVRDAGWLIDDDLARFTHGFKVNVAIVAGAGFFFEDEASVFAGHYSNKIASLGRIRRVLQSLE